MKFRLILAFFSLNGYFSLFGCEKVLTIFIALATFHKKSKQFGLLLSKYFRIFKKSGSILLNGSPYFLIYGEEPKVFKIVEVEL